MMPPRLVCLHGIDLTDPKQPDHIGIFLPGMTSGSASWRLDIRGRAAIGRLPISRTRSHERLSNEVMKNTGLSERWKEILQEHLSSTPRASGERGWVYKQRLLNDYPYALDFWRTVPGTARVFIDGHTVEVSEKDLADADGLTVLIPIPNRGDWYSQSPYIAGEPDYSTGFRYVDSGTLVVTHEDLHRWVSKYQSWVFGDRNPAEVTHPDKEWLIVKWGKPAANAEGGMAPWDLRGGGYGGHTDTCWPVPLGHIEPSLVSSAMQQVNSGVQLGILMNSDHPLVQWLWRTRAEFEAKGEADSLTQLASLLETPLRHGGFQVDELALYLAGWRATPELANSAPPVVSLEGWSVWRGIRGTVALNSAPSDSPR
jgi:hypothetical protein